MVKPLEIAQTFAAEYRKTPSRLKMLDLFMGFALLTAAIQFAYVLLVGTFPFNSFLAGFFCCIGFFVLTACLRLQVDPGNADFKKTTPERAFADYCLCMGLLFLVTWNYIG